MRGVLFEKEPKGGCSFLLTAEEKEPKKTVTPKAPYIGGCNRSSCRSYTKVSSDHQRSGLGFIDYAERWSMMWLGPSARALLAYMSEASLKKGPAYFYRLR